MKRFVAILALALPLGTAFAQDVSEPSAQPSPSVLVRQIGISMGVLPVAQKQCGHNAAEQARLKKGLAGFEVKLEGQLTKDLFSEYRSGAKQGSSLMANELKNMTQEQKDALCKEFNVRYEDMMEKFGEAAASAKGK